MKLYLHWLRYDLRRFRLPLTAWVLMVAAYVVFLGWLHLHILTVAPALIGQSGTWAAVLVSVEAMLLPLILGSDPAADTRAFWKTRPPSGMAVAAVKLTLVLAFFLILPLLAWLLMRSFCVQPGYGERAWTIIGGFCWVQAMLISACALGAAGSSGLRSTFIRTGQVLIVFFVLLLLAKANSILANRYSAIQSSFFWLQFTEYLLRGFSAPTTAIIALPFCCGLFWAARRCRGPVRRTRLAIFLAPPTFVLASSAVFTPSTEDFPEESLPPLPPEMAEKIKITPSALENTRLVRTGGGWRSFGECGVYQANLPVQGLPPDSFAVGRWLDLRLTAADGRVTEIDPWILRGRSKEGMPAQPAGNLVSDAEMPFSLGKLFPFFDVPSEASGTLRLTVYTKRESILNFSDPAVFENDLGRFQFARQDQPGSISAGVSTFEGAYWTLPPLISVERYPAAYLALSLLHLPSGDRLPLINYKPEDEKGTFLNYIRRTRGLRLQYPLPNSAGQDQQVRKPGANSLNQWRLQMNWFGPLGTVDIPVHFRQLRIPAPTAMQSLMH